MYVAQADKHLVLAFITLVFAGVARWLSENALTTLPVELFNGLVKLEYL